MQVPELIDMLKGNKSQTEFASEMGVSQSHISQVYHGKRGLNKKLVGALLTRFPEHQQLIIGVFLRSDNRNRDVVQ